MKKYLLIIASALLALAACTRFEDEASLAVVEAGTPSITVNSVGDTDFKATISPQSGTGFYSYAVIKGGATEVNATNLLKVKLGGTLAAGTVDYAKETTKVVELSELDRNTTYTVYAVAASEQGTVGSVVSQELTTSDGQNPSPTGASFADGVFTLTLSEAVEYTDKTATANYYAVNTPSGAEYDILQNIPVGSVPVKVEASGNKATFTLEEAVPNGAYIAVSYPAGTFEDAVGNPVAALNSGFGADEDGDLVSYGLTARQPVVNFDLTLYGEEEEVTSVSDLMSPIWIDVPEDYIHYKAVVPATSDVEGYSIVYEGDGESHTYTTAGPYDYGWNGSYNCALCYPNAMSGRPDPTPGQNITITIPEGFLIDIYGNTNNEFVIGPFLYSYGYTLEDLYGTYTLTADTQYAGSYEQEGIIIAPAPEGDEDYEGMDVIIYNLFRDTPCCNDFTSFSGFNTSFGATFNTDSGVLQLGWYDAIGEGSLAKYGWEDYVLALTFDTEDYTFGFQMPTKGELVLSHTVAVYCNNLGTWDRYQTTTKLVKVSDEYALTYPAAKVSRICGKADIQNKNIR